MNQEDIVWIDKDAIKTGLIADLEDINKGTTALYLVLCACADEETRIVELTFKDMGNLTGFSNDTIGKILAGLQEKYYLIKFSKQGSRSSVFKLV